MLKSLSPDASRDVSDRAQFLLEARVARAADASRVMAPRRVFEELGSLHAVYDWPAGRTLAALALPLEQTAALEIGIDVARAVESMHGQDIVHGALRVDGVIVEQEVRPHRARLLDLGLCVPRGRVQRTTIAAPRVSLAPENCHGAPLDERTDVYGFGGLCFEMLTGVPWAARGSLGLPSYIAPELARLVLRCLSPRPHDRPESMQESIAELERIRAACERANERSEAGLPAPFATGGFGKDAGWFIEEGTSLTTSQFVSLGGYQPQRGAGRVSRPTPVWVYGILALLLAGAVVLVSYQVLERFGVPRMQPNGTAPSGESSSR